MEFSYWIGTLIIIIAVVAFILTMIKFFNRRVNSTQLINELMHDSALFALGAALSFASDSEYRDFYIYFFVIVFIIYLARRFMLK